MSEQDKTAKQAAKDKEILDDQLKNVAGGARPPSGDSNPSDANNTTVDNRDIIKPHGQSKQVLSGDFNWVIE